MRYDYSGIYTPAQIEARAALLWASLTPAQIERVYRRAWAKLRDRSGSTSWDWPTLSMVYPQYRNAFKVIQCAMQYAVKG